MGRGNWNLPIDWEGCPKMSLGLVGDLFLTFKTPLNSILNSNAKKDVQFHLDDVFQEVTRLGIDKVLWIDLTNTQRYYSGALVNAKDGYTYLKMALPGHGLPPSKNERNAFNLAVDTFLAHSPTGKIGVHCTHGFNRTGYLISYYLMARKGFSAHNAMTEFRNKRLPGIYRKNYVDQLYQLGTEEFGETTGSEASFTPLVVVEPSWVNPNKRERDPITGLHSRRNSGNPNSSKSGSGYGSGNVHNGHTSSQVQVPALPPTIPSLFAEDELVANFEDDGQTRPRRLNPQRRAVIKARKEANANYNYNPNPMEFNWRNQNQREWSNPSRSNSGWDNMEQGQSWRNNNHQFLPYRRQRSQPLPPPPHPYIRMAMAREFGVPRPTGVIPRNNWQISRVTGQPIPFVNYQNGMAFPNRDQSTSRKRSYPYQ